MTLASDWPEKIDCGALEQPTQYASGRKTVAVSEALQMNKKSEKDSEAKCQNYLSQRLQRSKIKPIMLYMRQQAKTDSLSIWNSCEDESETRRTSESSYVGDKWYSGAFRVEFCL